MKILQIVADGNPGGGTTFVLEMVRSLENPVLITQENSYALEAAGNIPKFGMNFFASRLDPRVPLRLKHIIDEVKPNIIHVHGGRAAFFLSFVPKKHITIYTVHGLHGIYQGTLFSKWSQRKSIKNADLTVFVSHFEKNVALKYNLLKNNKYSVIPNGINPEKIPKRQQSKNKLLIFAGRLCPQKDPLFLLKVMEILGPKGYHLKVIGGGELEEEMRKSRYVTVTGKLSHQETLAQMTNAEAILVPSAWEAFGLVLLEAMALEIPIIASKIPPFEEVVGPLATLIDSKEPQKYADAVLSKKDYTQAAKKYFSENYLWKKCMNTYTDAYANILLSK